MSGIIGQNPVELSDLSGADKAGDSAQADRKITLMTARIWTNLYGAKRICSGFVKIRFAMLVVLGQF